MKTALSTKVKLSYGVGDFGTNLVLQFISILYLLYLTDVFNINPIVAGSIILVAKLWDAVMDPFIGSLIDATKSRWGKKRPYLLFGAVPLAASFALLFLSPDFSHDFRVVWALVTYILFCTAMSVVNIPYASLTVSITHDPAERTSLTSFRMTFALLGTLIAGGLGLVAVSAFGGGITGYRLTSLIAGGVMAVLIFIVFFGVREVQDLAKAKPANFRENVASVFKNPPFLILASASFLILTAVFTLAGSVAYYFKYNLQSADASSIGLAALFVSAVFYIPLLAFIAKRRGKRAAYLLAMGVFAVALIALYFLSSSGWGLTIGLFVLAGLGISAIYLMPWSMVADTIEYSEWKTGVRPEGAIYGYFLFMIKGAQALAGFIQGIVLNLSGYKANAIQSAQALGGITLLLSLIPATLVVAGMIVLSRYSLTNERHAQIRAEIAGRTAK